MNFEIGDHKFEARGLTRGQIKKLKNAGVKIQDIPEIEDIEKRDEAMMKVFKLTLTKFDTAALDDLTPGEALDLYIKVIQLTLLGEAVVKKLYESQESGSGAGSTPAASAKKKASRRKGAARK
jgi:hypothetical protein